ncbi:MAG: copper resistance system multicopper oxidase [Pseudomonadota bacterium]
MKKEFLLSFLILFQTLPVFAKTYDLEIKKQNVFITGKAVEAITINDGIPGPTLRWQEGEDVVVNVKNTMDETTSIHWHGILLNGLMDGVPGLNGFHGIAPHTTFTYKFKVRQKGTYWYHSHSNLQEQQGVYGSIVIEPNEVKADRDYVVLLSDFTEENPNTVLNNLKIDSGYYNFNKRTILTFFKDIKKNGFSATLRDYMDWGSMRMDPTDLSDVTRYHFLTNGKTAEQNWTGIFKKGERVKLRFINASAMTIYDVSIPGLKMKLVEADGQPVKPTTIDEFRFGVAETYDVIVEPKADKAYTIFAESIDRTGYARGTLALKEGMEGKITPMRPRAVLTMADMAMEGMDHSNMNMDNVKSGWAERGTSQDNKSLEYSDLISLYPQKDLRQPTREIEFKFGGSMNRYIWTINGEKFPKPMHLKYGEKVRLKFVNETMMAHPIHLHGMFMQLENGQSMKWMPNKHTVIVPPAQTVTLLLSADEAGEWAFHCHLLLHMASGMMTSVTVDKEGK